MGSSKTVTFGNPLVSVGGQGGPQSGSTSLGMVGGIPEHIHPAVGQLGLLYSSHKIVGGNSRCLALLRVFQQVIRDYRTPANLSLHRHLDSYLKPQIHYLVQCRPLSVSMGHAIRHLKWEIAHLPARLSDEEAKEHLCAIIDTYIRERIELADQLMIQHSQTKIKKDDVILIYAHSDVIVDVIVEASMTTRFSVIVVDSHPLLEGQKALDHIKTRSASNPFAPRLSYVFVSALGHIMKEVTKIFLGAHCVYSNGNVLSRAGTSLVAMMGFEYSVPVMVFCETYKFSDKVQLDSFISTEFGPQQALKTPTVLSILHDVTPSRFISLIVTEIGLIPCTSVPVVLREYRPFPV